MSLCAAKWKSSALEEKNSSNERNEGDSDEIFPIISKSSVPTHIAKSELQGRQGTRNLLIFVRQKIYKLDGGHYYFINHP